MKFQGKHFESKTRGTFPLGSCLNFCWFTHWAPQKFSEKTLGSASGALACRQPTKQIFFFLKSGISGALQILAALLGRRIQDFQIPCPSNLEIRDAPLPLLPCHYVCWKGTNKSQLLRQTQGLLKLEVCTFLIFLSINLLKWASQHFSAGCSVESLAIMFRCSSKRKRNCWFLKSSAMWIYCSLFLPLVCEVSELCLWKEKWANTSLNKRPLIIVCSYYSG